MTSATKTSTELVQSLYEAFRRGDIDFILRHVAQDCRWVIPGEGIPSSGTYTGPAGVAEFFRNQMETEKVLQFEPREFFANSDSVVALGFEECRSVRTGRIAATNWTMLFRLRGGMVTYFEAFFDTAAYVQAHRA
jgi:ketosteroid isomerase-like protein